MGSDEQFSLCWNNFHSNMSTGFHGLLSRGDLVDVTLAAEGRLLQAHKLVLSVCSPYFQEMFKMNPTQHPIVFLKDVSHSALRDLLQFMYQGEVNVKQEELAGFISTAEQLQVKGLTGNQNEENSTPASKPKPSSRPGPRSSQQRLSMTKPETDLDNKPLSNQVAVKRPNRPSITPSNPQSSQPAPAKRKCIDPLEAGPSGASSKEDFVTIPDEEDNAVAPKMEPEFVNEALWEDDDDGTNNDDGTFGEDDSNMEMSGFGDGSVTGDTTIAGATEGGAVGDAQDWFYIKSSKGTVQLVATNNIFYEDINSHEKRITWRCSKFYTRTPDRDRCQVSICLRSGLISYVKGTHNHPHTYIDSKHACRRCEVDTTGKYKITGEWVSNSKNMQAAMPIRMKPKDITKLKPKKLVDNRVSLLLTNVDGIPPINTNANTNTNSDTPVVKDGATEIIPENNWPVPGPISTVEVIRPAPEEGEVPWHIPTFEGFL